MSSTDYQQLQLLQQIQHHTLSVDHAYVLYAALSLPFLPISWKLQLYTFLTSLPLHTFSPISFILFIVLGPLVTVTLIYLLARFLITVLPLFVFWVMRVFSGKKNKQKVFLHLSFPRDTSKSAYATEQLYMLLHSLARQKTFLETLLRQKHQYSLEIVSTKHDGIRYVFVSPSTHAAVIKRTLISYMPGIHIQEISDYLPHIKTDTMDIGELTLANHFALPLTNLRTLSEHDPISYITGTMTKLKPSEMIALQLVTTPVLQMTHAKEVKEMRLLRERISQSVSLTPLINKPFVKKILGIPGVDILWWGVKGMFVSVKFLITFVFSLIIGLLDPNNKSIPFLLPRPEKVPQPPLSLYEQEMTRLIKEKIDLPLFETSVRILVIAHTKEEVDTRMSGLLMSFSPMNSPYQTLKSKRTIPFFFDMKKRFALFTQRTISSHHLVNHTAILSTTELADLYHFPYTPYTENMVKVNSRELPPPLSLKKDNPLDVTFGENMYGNESTPIGLTDDDRSRNMYIIGQTGSGKTTIMFHMAKDDIAKNRGIAVIDPHGDLVEDILTTIPDNRVNDLIYFNPFDLKHPIGINILELTPHLDEDDQELDKELVTEGVISIFRRVFGQDEQTNAHRIEYILRNTIYTAFTVKGATIFTIYELLTNPSFQKQVTKNLTDENLKNFWKNEVGRAGSYQVVRMVGGVTAKVGRFLFSPTAKRILEQPTSTINFTDILDQHKILLCNLSEGKIGEDTSHLLGTVIMTKIHQAALRRSRKRLAERTPFYLFVDEFQNFATTSFTKLLSGGRKFGLRVTIAQQSTAQQSDRNMVNVILANTATVICFRTASPVDEEVMLLQFAPLVTKGDIANLPRYHFYIRLSALNPEDTFSGITLPMHIIRSNKKIEKLITASQKNYTRIHIQTKNGPAAPKKDIQPMEETTDITSLR